MPAPSSSNYHRPQRSARVVVTRAARPARTVRSPRAVQAEDPLVMNDDFLTDVLQVSQSCAMICRRSTVAAPFSPPSLLRHASRPGTDNLVVADDDIFLPAQERLLGEADVTPGALRRSHLATTSRGARLYQCPRPPRLGLGGAAPQPRIPGRSAVATGGRAYQNKSRGRSASHADARAIAPCRSVGALLLSLTPPSRPSRHITSGCLRQPASRPRQSEGRNRPPTILWSP